MEDGGDDPKIIDIKKHGEKVKNRINKIAKRYNSEEDDENWELELKCGINVNALPIRWIWKYWLARGKLHVLAGQPLTSKTTVAIRMGSTVSIGGVWPDGSSAEVGNVVIWSGEDDIDDTLVPRLRAAGADLNRIFFADVLKSGVKIRPFDPAKDIECLQKAIEKAGGATLIIIDSIVSAISGDSHKNSETRRGLQPVVDIAKELNAAVLGITHFTKGTQGNNPLERFNGSLAFGALPRIGMVAVRDEENNKRMLMRAKSNIGPSEGGFEFELQLVPQYEFPDTEVPVVYWRDAIDGFARDVLNKAEGVPKRGGDAVRDAENFLCEFLRYRGENVDKPSSEVEEAAKANNHSMSTLRKARKNLDVKLYKQKGKGGVWMYSLKDAGSPVYDDAQDIPF